MKVIDLSGYSFSGKSAVYDLLQEFVGYRMHGKEVEFDLLRSSGGLLDLRNSLVEQWSPIRSSEAIRRFTRLIDNLGGNGRGLARLTTLGTHYEKQFPGFESHSRHFLETLCVAQWDSSWPFAYFEAGPLEIFWRKLLARLLRRDTMRSRVFLARPDAVQFQKATRTYMRGIFSSHAQAGCRALVLNNAFEPFAPQDCISLFDDARCIVVDRDPRDIYLSARRNGRVGNADVGRSVTGDSVDDFIARFRLYRSGEVSDDPRVLRLRFESLVEEYETTLERILDFLGESRQVHVGKGRHFRPQESVRSVRQWLDATPTEREAVQRIEQQLSSYCVC
jgi:hypothetical protein